jgi:FkbM family methyltransferase
MGEARPLGYGKLMADIGDADSRHGASSWPHAVYDLLWEKLHVAAGITGRNNNSAFVDLYLEICEELAPEVTFEIGAREAAFSKEIGRLCPRTACYAFEANPYVFNRFKDQIGTHVTYLNEAIGNETAQKQFHIPMSVPRANGALRLQLTNPTSSLKLRSADGVEYESVTCHCDTLDSWHERLGWPTSALWIDVEGAVDEVVRGAIRSLERSVQCAFVELEKSPAWKGQWLAADMTRAMEEMGFHALARDFETPWQYNQIFVSERAMIPRIIDRVGAYVDRILRRPAPLRKIEVVGEGNGHPSDDLADSRRSDSMQEQFPDRQKRSAWLLESKLLDAAEANRFIETLQLPRDFEDRVLARYGAAESIHEVEGVRSEIVIPAPPPEHIDPPRLTYDGPCPEAFAGTVARYLPIKLHEALTGKIYVGLKQTTLMLGKTSFFGDISKPASRWITPAFSECPGELKLPGTVAVLYANGATHFSHWMFDLLPKLEVLQRSGWNPDRVDYYLVNAFRAKFQKEAFRRLGIRESKVISISGGVVSADRLLVPSDVRTAFRTPAWTRDFIRKTFLPAHGRRGGHPEGRRLYISRAGARYRKVINEEQVGLILEKHGFDSVRAEAVPIAELAERVSQAEQIIAPHGAGVTNVVFGQPDIRMLEIYSAHIAPEGWALTHSVGGRHYLLAAHDGEGHYPWQEEAYRTLSHIQRNHADFFVEPHTLECAIEMMSA